MAAGRYRLGRQVAAALLIFSIGWSGLRISAYVLKVAIEHHLGYLHSSFMAIVAAPILHLQRMPLSLLILGMIIVLANGYCSGRLYVKRHFIRSNWN